MADKKIDFNSPQIIEYLKKRKQQQEEALARKNLDLKLLSETYITI